MNSGVRTEGNARGNLESYRVSIGEIDVIAVGDGYLAIDPKMLPAAKPEEIRSLLDDACLPQGPVRTFINGFVIETVGKRILVDAGLGVGPVETAGRMVANLAASGIAPESIDLILLTHLHRDHVRGITDEVGMPLFPKAEVMLHEHDLAFWTDEAEESRAPTFAKQYFGIARAALAPYKGRTSTFSKAEEIASGVSCVPAPGHTPGHTMYRVQSGNSSLLIAGDIVHIPALQFPRPDWSIALDVDPQAAAAMRCSVLDAAATDGEMLTGMHFSFPGFGHVRKAGQGFRVVPALWES
jgi:glyoxylase-like metal-dependent hydrolase (beta-lactamase superfamily II)